MDIIGIKDVGILGRQQNAVVLQYDKSIIITSDILNHGPDSIEPQITLDAIEEKIDIIADEILLSGKRRPSHEAEPIVYGEALVETLRWIIDILKTHKHPPNAPPIPDFFGTATERANNMDSYLLNQWIKHR